MNSFKIIFLLIISLFIKGCSKDEKPLRLSLSPWIGYETIYQADAFDWLDPKIELIKSHNQNESFIKVMSGEVDAAFMTIDNVILARYRGVDLTIVAVLDISAGADIMLSKHPIKNLQQLKGKRIGRENTALASLIKFKTLEKAGLTLDDVKVIDIPLSKQLQAWKANKVDVVITYEPFASEIIKHNGHYVISSRDLPLLVFDVMVVRTDRLKGRRKVIEKLLQAHFKTYRYFHEYYKDAIYRIASREGIEPKDVKRSIGGVILPSYEGNHKFFKKNSSLYNALSDLNALMYNKRIISKKISLENIMNSSYLSE